jgi:hypothetical protein
MADESKRIHSDPRQPLSEIIESVSVTLNDGRVVLLEMKHGRLIARPE